VRAPSTIDVYNISTGWLMSTQPTSYEKSSDPCRPPRIKPPPYFTATTAPSTITSSSLSSTRSTLIKSLRETSKIIVEQSTDQTYIENVYNFMIIENTVYVQLYYFNDNTSKTSNSSS